MRDNEGFYNELEDKGLNIDHFNHEGQYCQFDLNSGQIFTEVDPAVVYEVAQIGRRHSGTIDYGAHIALLQLVIKRENLQDPNKKCIYWDRPYYTECDEHPDEWISVRQWLTDQGFDMTDLYPSR